MRRIFLALFILFASLNLNAQIAKTDSLSVYERNSVTAQKLISWGRSSFITGGIYSALGGALIATPIIIDHFSAPTPPEELNEDMLSPIMFVTGLACAVVGISTVMIGIPVTIAGHGINSSDVFWKDQRYDSPGQQGYGVILDVAAFLYWFQVTATVGYHFNKRLFLGAGLGGSMDYYDAFGTDNGIKIDLPLYADFRYTIANRFISPYLGFRAGYDVLDNNPYLGADLGLRIRMSSDNPKSLWVSATGEVSGSYLHAGIKMGWSF